MSPLVSIIVVNYNTPELVEQCLASIAAHCPLTYEVIVVENASKKPVAEEMIAQYKNTSLLILKENRGFGGGNNAGAAIARGEFLWLLNSDALLVDRSIEQAFSLFSDRSVGIVSPYLYNDLDATKLQEDFCANFQSLSTLVLRRARPKLLADKPTKVDVVVGASLIIRRSLYEALGGFDEKIFMFMEDDDLCLRANQAGYRTLVTPSAKIVHLQGKSIAENKQRKRMYYASQDYYWKKHFGPGAATIMRALRGVRNGLIRTK